MHLSTKDCETYYRDQLGAAGSYFHGIPHQRGYGFFGDLGRHLTPLAIRASRYLAGRILDTGRNVIGDVASGRSFKDAARNRFRETSAKIKSDIFHKLQQGRGKKKKPIKRKSANNSTHSRAKRCKTTRRDIFHDGFE